MRNIPLEEAETRFRQLVAAARQGASFALTADNLPQARLLPPKRRHDGRDLDFLSLKRHLSSCGGLAGPSRPWRRADVYARRAP